VKKNHANKTTDVVFVTSLHLSLSHTPLSLSLSLSLCDPLLFRKEKKRKKKRKENAHKHRAYAPTTTTTTTTTRVSSMGKKFSFAVGDNIRDIDSFRKNHFELGSLFSHRCSQQNSILTFLSSSLVFRLSPSPLSTILADGWKRELIREGIESNPGPITWNAIKKKIIETYGSAWDKEIAEFEADLRSAYAHTLDQMDEEDVRPLVAKSDHSKFKRVVWMVMEELIAGLHFLTLFLSFLSLFYLLAHSTYIYLLTASTLNTSSSSSIALPSINLVPILSLISSHLFTSLHFTSLHFTSRFVYHLFFFFISSLLSHLSRSHSHLLSQSSTTPRPTNLSPSMGWKSMERLYPQWREQNRLQQLLLLQEPFTKRKRWQFSQLFPLVEWERPF